MEQIESFNDFLRCITTDKDYKIYPIVVGEYGVYRIVGYNHVISCDYEFEKYQKGINSEEANDLFNKDVHLCEVALISRYNEISEKKKYEELNPGCRKLLLQLLYCTGNIQQFDKVIKECQDNRFYEALRYSGRKNIMDFEQNEKLKEVWEQEKQYFMENFDKFGEPKFMQQQLLIIQHSEEEENDAEFLIKQRFQAFQQGNIVPLNSSFTKMNYLSKEFLEFTKEQQGRIYNFGSYNQAKKKWFPVEVPDQSFKIIGYSHRCSKEEELRFSVGLETEHVNHLFLLDYQNNCTLLKRYLQKNFPKYNFERLPSQAQLILIDIAFRNIAFQNFETAIQLALENNIDDAIEACNIYYRPDLNVHVHYLERIDQLKSLIRRVDEQYCHQSTCDWNDEKYNNIVGIKMNAQGFQFIFDAGAANKIKINDLITCLKVLYDPELDEDSKILYFSLEFEDNDFEMENQFQKKVYFPEYLEGSEIGEILYESDFILKQMSLGIQVLNRAPLQVQEFNYGALPIQPLYKIDPDYFARLFIKYGSGDLKIVDDYLNDYKSYVIEDIKLIVDAKYLDENGNDHQIQDPDNAAVIFANNFASLYDDIAKRYPVFIRLKEVFMANMLAKYMYNQKLKIDYQFVTERFQKTLIQNYKKSQSPTLRMKIENEIMEFNLTGGVTTDTQNHQEELNKIIEKQRNEPVTQQTQTQIKTDDATFNVKISELEKVSTISTQPSVSDLHDLLPKKKCGNCSNDLEQCEQDLQYCKGCQGLRCQQCQQHQKNQNDLKTVKKTKLCKSCIKCKQCNLQIDWQIVEGQNELLHNQCISLFKESTMKKKMKGFIKKSFVVVKQIKGDTNDQILYYLPEECKCIKLKCYTNYVVGYLNPIKEKIKNTTFNINHYKVTQEKANLQFEEDMKVFEKSIENFHEKLRHPKENIQEEIVLLQLITLFIIKDEGNELILNLVNELNYSQIIKHFQKELKCPRFSENHNCTYNEKINKIKEFFNLQDNSKGQKHKKKTQQGLK